MDMSEIGRTYHDSVPWWPQPAMPREGSPNVVMIVFDDVGFADFGCYGSEIDTPNIDGLAATGLRYNNFHTTALCSPTRACLLTGRNHHSVGMGVVSNWDTGFPGYRGSIDHRAGTLAEILRTAGYNTFAAGKWHLTPPDETTAAGPFDQWPTQRGFDRFYGFLDGATDQYTPDLVVDCQRIDSPRRDGYHLSEDLVDQSLAFVGDQHSAHPEKPFFLYLCFGTAHYPLQAPAWAIDKYADRYQVGWDAVRAERFARQKELGIIPADTELAPPNDGVVAWDELSTDEQRIAARLQAAYAGMLHHTDQQIGRLLAGLEHMGARDDTLVVVLSDNGATLEGGPLGSLNYLRYVNGLPPTPPAEILEALDEIGGPTTCPMYPMGWGMASNTPLKRYKQNTHGGGIRDPLIMSWPARMPDGGGVRDQYHHAIDITPTVLELCGIEPPEMIRGMPQMPIEGVSMAYSFTEPEAPTAKTTQYFEMLGNRAIWHKGWKAVTYHAPGSDFENDRWELYHLDEDFSECRDLAADHPAKVEELAELWWAEAGKHNVLPLDDRIMERFLVPKPRPITARSRFVYFAGAQVPSAAMPDIKNVSYSICVEVDRTGDGVLVSCGDRFSGYALFVENGLLVHDYNAAGTHHLVRTDEPVPEGQVTLEYRFRKSGDLEGTGEMYVDGLRAGSGHFSGTLAYHLSPTGITVGRSPVSAPSNEYIAPFPFDGEIRRVVIEVGDDQTPHEQNRITAIDD